MRDGCGGALQGAQGIAEVIVRNGQRCVDRESAPVACDRLFLPAENVQDVSGLDMRGREIGFDGDGFSVMLERFLAPAKRRQGDAEIVVRLRGVRISAEGRLDQLDGFAVFALLAAEDPEHMERAEVLGLYREDRPVAPLRVRDIPLHMQGGRLVKRLGDGGGRPGRDVRHAKR